MQTDPGVVRECDLALLIADLSGYTALAETHGGLEAARIVLRFETLIAESLEPDVALINCVGDDVFCAGPDALAVVRSALRLRDRVAREREFPRVRTGIHAGSVVVLQGKYFGASINLAARLADLAVGGQVLCTAVIAQAARVLADIEPCALGERHFRNVAQPIAVYELARPRERRGTTAIDPVCRMQVIVTIAAASVVHGDGRYYFCSEECARRFGEMPQYYVDAMTPRADSGGERVR